MPVTLGKNITALGVNDNLQRSTEPLTRTFERLPSGLRINRPSDDPAGASVASALSAQSRIFTRAALNISDGQSLINITDGALDQISNVLTRLGELAEQAANGSYSSTQRGSTKSEYNQLLAEIKRIAATTTFNNQILLVGNKANSTTSTQTINLGSGSDRFAPRGISADGRFLLLEDKNDIGEYPYFTLSIYDRTTGQSTLLGGGSTAEQAGMAADGTVFFYDETDSRIKTYNPYNGTTKTVAEFGGNEQNYASAI